MAIRINNELFVSSVIRLILGEEVENNTEGIVLKQVKTLNSRRMLTLFTLKYGKISAGTSINEKSRSKAALALRPFTYSGFEIRRGRGTFNINSADTIHSFYGLGEDIERFSCSSYALEFLDKLLPEEQPANQLFNLLLTYLKMTENRTKKHRSLLTVFQWKAIQYFGIAPEITKCCICGSPITEDSFILDVRDGLKCSNLFFSIPEGGLVCSNCKMQSSVNQTLLYKSNIDIIGILKFIHDYPLKSFEKLALDHYVISELDELSKQYISYHLGIKTLKSESFLTQQTES